MSYVPSGKTTGCLILIVIAVSCVAMCVDTIGSAGKALLGIEEKPKPQEEVTEVEKTETTQVEAKKAIVDAKKSETTEQEDSEPSEKELAFIELKYSSKERPKTIEFSGKAKHGLRWQDRNGENWFVFSVSTSVVGDRRAVANLYATHFAIKDGETTTLRKVKELRPGDCEWDWTAYFDKRAISLTDLDNDGYGEITFAYRIQCASDLGPNTYKLLVLENGEKHILRGEDIVQVGENEFDGSGKYKSEGFKDAKPLFKHAKKVWKKTVRASWSARLK